MPNVKERKHRNGVGRNFFPHNGHSIQNKGNARARENKSKEQISIQWRRNK